MNASRIWRIACNEWRSWRHARVPMLLLCVLTVVWLVAGFAAYHHWQDHAQTVRALTQRSEHDWQSQPDRHPHRVSHYGDFVAKPLHPLTVIEPGILDASGHLVYLEAHRLNSVNFNPATEANSVGRFPMITPGMIVEWWMPLCLIMMAYATVTREQLDGTLAYIRINGVRGWQIAAGKYLALWLPFFLMLALQGLWAGYWSLGSEQAWIRCGLMLLAQSMYLSGWCLLIVAVSWWSRHCHAALLTLLLCWVCIGMIVPRGLANLAQVMYPTPPRAEAENYADIRLKSLGDSHNPDDPHFVAFKAKILKQYGVTSIEALPVNYHGLLMQEGERLTTAVYREQQALHDAQLAKQSSVIRCGLWFSPALALRYVQMASSGNDLAHQQAFIRQAEVRRYQLIQYLNQLHISKVQQAEDKQTRLSASLWRDAPRPAIQLPTIAVSQPSLQAAFCVLLVWVLLPAWLLIKASRCR